VESNRQWSVSVTNNNHQPNQPHWLTIAPVNNVGNSSFTITAARNDTGVDRIPETVTVRAGDAVQTFTVTQLTMPIRLDLDPNGWSFDVVGGHRDINLTTLTGIRWEIVEDAANEGWLSVERITPSTQVGSGSFRISAERNYHSVTRTGEIRVIAPGAEMQRLRVQQSAAAPYLRLAERSLITSSASANATVRVFSNGAWSAVSTAPGWLTVESVFHENQIGNGHIVIGASENPGPGARGADIIVTLGSLTERFTVTQSPTQPFLELRRNGVLINEWHTGHLTASANVQVSSNRRWDIDIPVHAQGWLSYGSITPANQTNNGSFTLSASGNPNNARRDARVTVTADGVSRFIDVSQDPRPVGNMVTITYNPNGGMSVHPQTVSIPRGTAIGEMPIPFRTLSPFVGWYTQPIGGVRIHPQTVIGGDITVYARWMVRVTFVDNVGSGFTQTMYMMAGVPYGSGSFPVVSGIPSEYRFEGWFTEPEGGVLVTESSIVSNYIHRLYARGGTVWIWHTFNAEMDGTIRPDWVGFWPGAINVSTTIVGSPPADINFHAKVTEARNAWSAALGGVSITPVASRDDAQIRMFLGNREALAYYYRVTTDLPEEILGWADYATTHPAGTITVDGIPRNVRRFSGFSNSVVLYDRIEGNATLNNFDLANLTRMVTMHEMGHSLGFSGHSHRVPENRSDVMWPSGHPGYALRPLEIRHLRQIYDHFR